MYDPVTALPNRVHFRREAERILVVPRQRRGLAVHRSRRLQGGQRPPRPRPGRPGAGHGRQPPSGRAQGRGRRTARWRRPCSPASPATSSPCSFPRSRPATRRSGSPTRALAALAEPFKSAGGVGADRRLDRNRPRARARLRPHRLMKAADIAMYHAKAAAARACAATSPVSRAPRKSARRSKRRSAARVERARARAGLRAAPVPSHRRDHRRRGADPLERRRRLPPPVRRRDDAPGDRPRRPPRRMDPRRRLQRARSAGAPPASTSASCFPVAARQFERLDFIERLRGGPRRAGSAALGRRDRAQRGRCVRLRQMGRPPSSSGCAATGSRSASAISAPAGPASPASPACR